MSRIVFLLEERSMQVLLDGLLPRLFPDLPFLCVPHAASWSPLSFLGTLAPGKTGNRFAVNGQILSKTIQKSSWGQFYRQ